MVLTNREKELVKSAKGNFEDFIKESEKIRENFWTKEYPKYVFRKKIKTLAS